MNYNTVYVGMDVHKESFTLCAYTIGVEEGSHFQRATEADCKMFWKLSGVSSVSSTETMLPSYAVMRPQVTSVYTLYHQLTEHHVNCVILAPTTMLEQRSKEKLRLTGTEMQK